MPEAFDGYRKWLGIPPKDQPPNHYRLLGIERFEDDPDVIDAAADQRMAHVRTYQTGKNSALSQKILNELSAARICLLDPQKKVSYDAKLRAERPGAADQDESPAETENAFAAIVTGSSPSGAAAKKTPRRAAKHAPAIVAGVVLLLATAVWLARTTSRDDRSTKPPQPTATAQDSAPTPAQAAQRAESLKSEVQNPKSDVVASEPASPMPSGAPAAPQPASGLSPDREVAEETLRRGGKLTLLVDGKLVNCDQIATLPDAEFVVFEVHIDSVDDSKVADLAFLAKAKSLEIVRLWNSHVSPTALTVLANHPSLKHLQLQNTRLPTGTVRSLLPLPKLEGLLLEGCEITRDDLFAILTLKNLLYVGLQGARIGDDDMPSLEQLPKLQHIYLHGIPLTNIGLAAIIRAAPLLETLNVSGTKITDEGLPGLIALKELKWLDIAYNSDIKGSSPNWLPDLPHLEWLKLNSTKITDDSLDTLPKLPSIKSLFLSDTAISDRGLGHLSRFGTLEAIELNKTRITTAGIADFKKSLPNCQVVFEPSPVDLADAPVTTAPAAAKPMPTATAAKASDAPLAGRQPVPDKEAVEKARRELQSRFKAEWTGGKNAGSKRLAARELEKAATAADAGAVEKWVLLSQAIDVWAAAADYDAAANTADLLAAQFDISALSRKADALRGVSRAAKSEEKPKVIDQALRLVLEAIDRDEYDTADELTKLAVAAARSAGGRARADLLKLAAKDVAALARQFAEVKTDAERLRSAVDDAAANLAVGKFDCEAKHDWTRGLPRLAKGTDPALADLAKKDLAQPADAGQIRELAAAWLAAAERANVKSRAAYQERAIYWLAAARRASNEAAREDIDKRIAVIEAAATYRARPFRWCEELLLGVEYAGEIDCAAAARRFELGPTFELGKSWTLDLEFNAPAEISTGQLFFIGDGRGGRDPLFVRLAEDRHLVVGVCDATSNEGGGICRSFHQRRRGQMEMRSRELRRRQPGDDLRGGRQARGGGRVDLHAHD